MKRPASTHASADTDKTGASDIARSAGGKSATSKSSRDAAGYLESCQAAFWRNVFREELEYLTRHLEGCKDVLSVGCGPAIIESGLSENGFCVTGLDVSQEALACAPDHVRTVAGRAEDMDFPECSFDAVIYVASLQFIEDYRKAIEKTAQVLRPAGRLIALLLNPLSEFFREKVQTPSSYVRKIRHTNLEDMEATIQEHFHTQTEYFMGVREGNIFESQAVTEAGLYVIRGTRKRHDEEIEA
jgi:ubiquinone/menaquinone biosynthesis C-methylase UbiE